MKLNEWRNASKLPKHETDMIIKHVCGLDRLHIIINAADITLTDEQSKELCRLHDARFIDNYPLQYLLGYSYFMGLELCVTPDVLIPRPDTEFLVSEAISCIDSLITFNKKISVLDLCTGSGCIAVYLADFFKNNNAVSITASDISEKALTVAEKNSKKYNTNINFIHSDLFNSPQFDNLKFDVIVSNPPYISYDEKNFMSEDTLNHEPHLALFAEDSGMAIYKRIANEYRKHLNPGGHIIMEVGFKQAEAVVALFESNHNVKIIKDFNDYGRVVHVADK